MAILLMEMDEVRIVKMLSRERVYIATETGTASSGVPIWEKRQNTKKITNRPSILPLLIHN